MTPSSLRYRALLTDTLPYEVPVIFSNSILHASLSAPPPTAAVAKVLSQLRTASRPYSKPYLYDIAKGVERTTTLGVIHPIWQIKIADFYEEHSASILAHCADERFSLRRPATLASPFIEEKPEDLEGRLKLGVAQLAADAGEPDVSHLTTYFAYRKYNLLGKFSDSREHQRLEMRFLHRRSLDVSKCFYNIYTHSVTWAIKGKEYSKKHANSYTFEGQLDTLFQKSNYNETNGIVVGPEFSRIFAEIILQRVDKDIVEAISASTFGAQLEVTKDYDVRRYVDDYYIFGNSLEVLDRVEATLKVALEQYKLYLNSSKRETLTRPFVSPISLARYEIGGLVRELWRSLREIRAETTPAEGRDILRSVRSLLSDVRFAIRTHGVHFENVSGWLLGKYRVIARAMLRRAATEDTVRTILCESVATLVDASIYVCAVDMRVRTTYSLCQLIELVEDNKEILSVEQIDQFEHSLNDGIVGIIRTLWSDKASRGNDGVELYNLLIAGTMMLDEDFLNQTLIWEVLRDLVNSNVTYFRYITVKFCLLRTLPKGQGLLDMLNGKVAAYLRSDRSDWRTSAEDFLLLSDFLSAPDIGPPIKREMLSALARINIANATAAALAPHVGFVDWSGLSVKHLLRRKTLRPVYTWG